MRFGIDGEGKHLSVPRDRTGNRARKSLLVIGLMLAASGNASSLANPGCINTNIVISNSATAGSTVRSSVTRSPVSQSRSEGPQAFADVPVIKAVAPEQSHVSHSPGTTSERKVKGVRIQRSTKVGHHSNIPTGPKTDGVPIIISRNGEQCA